MTRAAHWIKVNHQERMPPRMVAFDTEARSTYEGDTEIQEWRVGCAIRWRTDTKASDHRESMVFDSPEELWRWISDYCRVGTRTVVWAHNLGYDVRTSRMFEILPKLGYHLEWCNLDRNVSSATWRSDHGTIVIADTWTWIPLPLAVIAGETGTVKYDMPARLASNGEWARYCMQDCEILHRVVCALTNFIRSENLGNWQPTGAGMAYATWRHKFLTHKVLVHDDNAALAAERGAMHTGRAEAWRHGKIHNEKWTELDLRNAYVTIAASTDIPRKLHMHGNAISLAQYDKLHSNFAVLARVKIDTDVPCVPYKTPTKTVWPVGSFETWLWDAEVDVAIKYANSVRVCEWYTYVRDPILADWAKWVLDIIGRRDDSVSGIVRTHVKHCGRALIGRIALRVPSWEYFGANPEGITGITHVVIPEESRTTRMLHVGEDTLIETSREESKDSCPMVTGYIMSKCRAILWEYMNVAGLDDIAHVDTDSLLCNSSALDRIRRHDGNSFSSRWSVKGTYTDLEVFGPRSYYRDRQRVTAGIPLKAEETAPGSFSGVRWSAVATDLEARLTGSVRLTAATWQLRREDPRRADAAGACGRTRAYAVAELGSANGSSSASGTSGS